MLQVGRVKIIPLFEANGDEVIQWCVAEATPEAIKGIAWLRPYYAYDDGALKGRLQSFLIEAGGKKIVVDTGMGNGRTRPAMPTWQNLNTDYLERLTKAFRPEAVDYMLCTHFHSDHVGWNTYLMDDKWLPTFPNAQYIFCEDEFNYWKDKPAQEFADDLMGVEESVMPIYEAGLAKLVPADYRVNSEISLLPTPGHTPGHVSVLIESEGQRAVISGDALHHPCQIAHPEWNGPEEVSEQANKTRRALLERFADTETLFIGSHFADPVAGKIKREGRGFRLV